MIERGGMDMNGQTETTLSQKERILRHLQHGGEIDPMRALKAYGCMRLGARIWELKRDGHIIHSGLVHNRLTGKSYAVYWMN
jgi:hypothetical protein